MLAIALLGLWYFHPVLFALLDAVMELFSTVERAREARSKSTGAPIPLADEMDPFRMDVVPSEIGTSRVIPVPKPALVLARYPSARKMVQRDS
ncbi:hypothetical protein [Mesorhizobium huakuii]|uniref:Uncharacterized protein n=1 Tax=Mesorhizobium huakuii TaxID=28104 RepID=A0A7G6SPH1_9HYPH|nr:hypothetical protein [Mesorhizobium huakuii]QND56403.1 hypothetical protein HB778_07050 [Mesorhizobium huakuii]